MHSTLISTAKSALDIWQDEAISQLTSQDSMELDTMRDQKTAYFVIVPEDQVHYFSTLINLFYQECFEQAKAPLRRSNESLALKQARLLKNEKIATHGDYELLRRDKPKAYKRLVEKYRSLEREVKNQRIEPLYFFLDEFGNLGKLDGFARTANTIRKYGCSLTVILQAKSQLEATYGLTESQSIMEALVSKLYMAGMGLEMTQYLEKVLGNTTLYDTQTGGFSEYGRTIGVPLMRSDEIRMLPSNLSILVSGRERPALLETPPFYEVGEWLEMTKGLSNLLEKA